MKRLPPIYSVPEIPRKEEVGGIWSVFHAEEAYLEIDKVITSYCNISQQPPYRISGVLQLPASLRLNISHVKFYSCYMIP